MSKNILQDIKPLTSSSRRRTREHVEYNNDGDIPTSKHSTSRRMHIDENVTESLPRKSKKGLFFGIIITGLVIGLVLSLVNYFGGATVTVNPKTYPLVLSDMAVTAYTDPKEGDLAFQVMIVDDEVSTSIEAKDISHVERQAKGTVVIYNEYNSQPQKLKIDTRLETKDGKIYKTDKAVTVPGFTTKGGITTPGQVEVGIYADKIGAEYNGHPTDFTIFGFKGSPKYDKFYAKSKGEISGGQNGDVYTVPSADIAGAMSDLSTKLKTKLYEDAKAQIPVGFVSFENASIYDDDQPIPNVIDSTTKTVPITRKAKLSVVLFNEEKLASYLGKTTISQFQDGKVTIPEIKNFVFSFKDKNDSFLLKDAKTLSFKISGEGTIVYSVDSDKIIESLLGKKKSEFKTIFESFVGIEKAEIKLSPPWRTTFPTNKADARVVISS
jgi:hypothetical protein